LFWRLARLLGIKLGAGIDSVIFEAMPLVIHAGAVICAR
jgi:hypothetical protein